MAMVLEWALRDWRKMVIPKCSLPLLIGVGLALACDSTLGIDEEARIGVIAFHGDPVVITVPDTVQAGVSFEVSVLTYGDGCLSKGGATIQIVGLSVDVTPYDIHSGAEVCELMLNHFDHRATLTLRESGVAQISFHGKQLPGDSLLTVVREVVVE